MSVLKRKIEEQIEQHCGQQLDELAAIAVKANNDRWRHKRGIKKAQCELRGKLSAFFNSDTCCKGTSCQHEGHAHSENHHNGHRHGSHHKHR